MIKDIEQGIADFISDDKYLHDNGHITVVVEEKADTAFEISKALAELGVCVLVDVTGFTRVQNSPLVQGTLEIEIVCYEHPSLNRDDENTLTAQAVMERLANILHYKKFPFFVGKMIFKDFRRDDVDEANIVRGNFEVNTELGYEDLYFHPEKNNED